MANIWWLFSSILGLEVKPSTIPGARLGLFATRDMKAGQILGLNYSGRLVPMTEANESTFEHPYAVQNVLGHNYIIADTSAGGVLRYANDSRDPTSCHGHLYLRGPRVVVAGLAKDVKAGEEVFVSYGNAYWEGLK